MDRSKLVYILYTYRILIRRFVGGVCLGVWGVVLVVCVCVGVGDVVLCRCVCVRDLLIF